MMRNKNYFEEIDLDPAQLEQNLDAVVDQIFTFHRLLEEATTFRFKSRKAKYRVVSQQRRTECRAGE